MNRPNIDDRFDVMTRVVVRPLASRSDALKRFHVGGGMRFGRRDSHYVRYDAPNLWATKHIRLTAEYSLYHFPGEPTTRSTGADNQAVAPGARAGTKPDANALQELSFRVGLAL